MGHSWVSLGGWGTLILSLIFAVWKGSWAERSGAIVLFASNVTSDIAMAMSAPYTPELVLFIIDFLLAVSLLILALRFSSLWLGTAMFLQSIALATHAYVLSGEGPTPFQWMLINNVISQLMLLCILAATFVFWTRHRVDPPSKADGLHSAVVH